MKNWREKAKFEVEILNKYGEGEAKKGIKYKWKDNGKIVQERFDFFTNSYNDAIERIQNTQFALDCMHRDFGTPKTDVFPDRIIPEFIYFPEEQKLYNRYNHFLLMADGNVLTGEKGKEVLKTKRFSRSANGKIIFDDGITYSLGKDA